MGTIYFNFLEKKIKDKKALLKIKENYLRVVKNGEVIKNKKLFPVKFDNYTIWLQEGTCAPEMMTFLEMFKEKVHTRHNSFIGDKDRTILDIGANEGHYTLKMKQNNSNLKIIAFEPISNTFNILRKNIFSNRLENISLINKAVGMKDKNILLEYVPEVTAISSSKIDLNTRPWLDKKRIKRIKVNCISLSSIFYKFKLKRVDIMKIDTEGAELDILIGGKDVLDKINKIVIEFHSDKLKKDCIKVLTKNGFRLVMKENKSCGDIYFIRNNYI